jgi:arylsulfatase A-like enzyme
MIHKTFILSTIIIFFLISCNQKDETRPPNIILILTDDQGWGDLSITGNTNLETPNIDRLSEEGISFERFFVSPVCSPTRTELLTGRYHPRGGVYSTSAGGERLDADETTIADFFKKAGYATAAYGKWHNGMQAPYHPNARGFDDFYGFCSGHWGDYFSPMLEHNGTIVKGNGFIVDDFTDRGINFIEKNKDRPFLLYLPYNTPHSPMQVPDKWWNKFENRELKLTHQIPEREDIPFTQAALAMCENIDWNVGRITGKIEELGLTGNTIIIYLSDNGPNGWRWNDGMKGRKGSTDEGGVRVPFFMKWQGHLPAGKKITRIAGGIDLLPTLADLARIEFNPQKPLDGISLKNVMIEEVAEENDRLIFSHWAGRTSVRNQKFRLDADNKLFDMENDPGQNEENASEIYPDVLTLMKKAKEEWIAEVLSELPEEDNRPFTIGHPDFISTQMPARDGIPFGNIQRSNRYPNDSFFTNWKSTSDSILWKAEVLTEGNYDVEIYYTCPPEDVGSTYVLSFSGQKLTGKVTTAHHPPLKGMENDRVERMESYVKEFIPMKAGSIYLPKGEGILTLKATNIPGSNVMDVRLIMLKRL